MFFCGLAIVLITALFWLDVRPDAFTDYLPTTLSFIAVGVVTFLGLYDSARDRAFSLNVSHWTYVLFFLFYAPFVQFLVATSAAQSDIGAFDHYAIWINCMTLAWCGIYYFFYGSPDLSDKALARPTNKPRSEPLMCTGWTYLLVIFLCVAAFGAIFLLFGVEVLLLRGAGSELTDKTADKSTFLIVNSVCRAIPVVVTGMLMLTRGKSKWVHWGTFALSALFTLVMNSPLAIARFWFGAILIGFCCLYIHIRKIRITGLWISVALTLAGLTIFPVLSATRYATSADQLNGVEVSNDWSSNLTSADFDGYAMIIATVEWARREGPSNGFQLIGNSLFWVPRVLWYDKPVGSGQMVAEYFDMININMAEPMTAEAYVNFGWLGVPIYAFFIARLFSAVDRRYWGKGQRELISVLSVTYPFLTALTIYFLRGDYLSGLSSSLSLLGSAALVIWVFHVSSRRIPTNS
ncbi:hypothetical protein IAD21_02179 [Abditibacteriota bacterium]|nr:hypothetical protein IAD21_02179 [Abditibacteriota bacterium]